MDKHLRCGIHDRDARTWWNVRWCSLLILLYFVVGIWCFYILVVNIFRLGFNYIFEIILLNQICIWTFRSCFTCPVIKLLIFTYITLKLYGSSNLSHIGLNLFRNNVVRLFLFISSYWLQRWVISLILKIWIHIFSWSSLIFSIFIEL